MEIEIAVGAGESSHHSTAQWLDSVVVYTFAGQAKVLSGNDLDSISATGSRDYFVIIYCCGRLMLRFCRHMTTNHMT